MKAFDDQERMEEKAHASFQHVKKSEAPVCKKCQSNMVAKITNDGNIRWLCMNILEGCYHSFLEDE